MLLLLPGILQNFLTFSEMDFSSSPSGRPRLTSLRDWLLQIFFGLCIGAADLIPGISGGSMALILGIYEKLIYSVKSLGTKDALSLFYCDWKTFSKKVSWDFLLGLLIGIVIVFTILPRAIQWVLGHEVYRASFFSLFAGMIIFCALVCFKQVKNWKKGHVAMLVLGAVLALFLTGSRKEGIDETPHYHVSISPAIIANAPFDLHDTNIRNYDPHSQKILNVSELTLSAMLAKGYMQSDALVQEISTGKEGRVGDFVQIKKIFPIDMWLIFCGSIAVTAMLLPGISGSYLLTILGAYSLVISSLADFFRDLTLLTVNVDALIVLVNIGVGIAIGALLFSHMIAWLLKNYHAATMAALTGFMLGALRTVWPFWTYSHFLDPLKLEKGMQLHLLQPYFPPIFSLSTGIAACFLLAGCLIVFTLEACTRIQRT